LVGPAFFRRQRGYERMAGRDVNAANADSPPRQRL